MTFFIALFILVMQFLWRYVDDLVGKGLEWYVLSELLFYASLQVVPMALPLAILLSSLMTFGNLGENYELTALKAAGISLPKIMAPLVVTTIIISVAAFKFSNNLLPVANLKLYSLLYSVKQARPELDIKEKIFYDGIDQFSIKIEEKDRESNILHDIMIYDHRDRLSSGNTNVTLADSGRLFVSSDKKYMVLTLFDGTRYDEKATHESRRLRPRDLQMFRVDNFSEQTALIELKGFDFSRTDEGLFKSSDRMKNLDQLKQDEDSLNMLRGDLIKDLSSRVKIMYFSKARYVYRNDDDPNLKIIDQSIPVNTDSIFDRFTADQKQMTYQSALRQAQDNKQSVEDQMHFINEKDQKIIRHQMEWHRKFTLPFACFIFFFIGAPLGAIIRKGGLGMPVVISILFFITYYIIDTFGAKLAREGVWIVYQGMWLSSFILLPLGIFLTYKSSNDSALLNADAYIQFFQKLLKPKKNPKSPDISNS